MRKGIIGILIICLLISGVSAEEPFDRLATNLTGLKVINGEWTSAENGLAGKNKSAGDCFIMSDVNIPNVMAITYSADIKLDGTAAGIVFGVQDPQNPSAHWYCMNVDIGNKEAPLARIFKVADGGLIWSTNTQLDEFDETKEHNYKITIDSDGLIVFYLDDEYKGEYADSEYKGGYLGVVTCLSDSTFNNLNYVENIVTPSPEPTEKPSETPKPATATASAKPQATGVTTATPNIPVKDDEGNIAGYIAAIFAIVILIAVVTVIIVRTKKKE